jgi:DNA ligase-1
MSNIDRPMLACDYDPSKLVFPALFSPKLDGYRMFNSDGLPLTRSGKPLANIYARALFSGRELEGLDGELIVGAKNDKNAFSNTSGPMRTFQGEPLVTWHIFDDRTFPSDPFDARLARAAERAHNIIASNSLFPIEIVEHKLITSLDELDEFEEEQLLLGFEGVMKRAPKGPYKFGRSTVKEGYLLKVKRFSHDEAIITRLEEQMQNMNEPYFDELDRQKRPTNSEGLVPSGMVGSFWVQSPKWPREFKISAGSMSHKDKEYAFKHPEEFIGQLARFKWFPHGTVDVPRHGLFDGIRDPNDMS